MSYCGDAKLSWQCSRSRAALLFAFATVRNAQPGTPPIGTYSDFISFFWAEVIIALCLVVLVFTWLLRPAK